MTDISTPGSTVHNRLGASAHWDGEHLSIDLEPRPEVLHHGVVRSSVLAFLVDAVGAIRSDGRLSQPLRQEAGIEVVEPAGGVVQVEVTPALTNPAGTLQGAMVAAGTVTTHAFARATPLP